MTALIERKTTTVLRAVTATTTAERLLPSQETTVTRHKKKSLDLRPPGMLPMWEMASRYTAKRHKTNLPNKEQQRQPKGTQAPNGRKAPATVMQEGRKALMAARH